MHILLQGESYLASVNKLLLLSICYWCILVILEGVSLKRGLDHVRVIISVTGNPFLQQAIEPLARCLKLKWQLAGIDLEIAVDAWGCSDECSLVVTKLISDGVVVPHLSGTPDLVLNTDFISGSRTGFKH